MEAVSCLHKKNIQHKNITPASVLTNGAQAFLTKFGIGFDYMLDVLNGTHKKCVM